jgi:hypothetical protein
MHQRRVRTQGLASAELKVAGTPFGLNSKIVLDGEKWLQGVARIGDKNIFVFLARFVTDKDRIGFRGLRGRER